ncbi:MAG: hypothetical protein ACE5FC_03580 [Myxococcota bacterium]
MKIGRRMLVLAVTAILVSPAVAVGAAPGGGRFAPTDLEKLQLWLDAADRKTLYQDVARKKAARAGGDPVALWRDKSGGGRDAVQADAGARPSYQPKAQNGRSGLRFDGENDWLDAGAFAQSFGPVNWTVFLVVQPKIADASSERGAMAALVVSDPAGRGVRRGFQIAPNLRLEYKNKQREQKRNVKARHKAGGDWEIWEIVNDGGNVSIAVDGAEKASERLEPEGDAPYPEGAIGGYRASGKGVEDLWSGHIGEIIVYGDPKNAVDRGQVRHYLAARWGMTLKAPEAGAPAKGGNP